MPIKVKNDLPARQMLLDENIFVMSERRAAHQDIRPLKIVILNLMPKKQQTERQLLRMLSNTPLQVEVTLLKPSSYESKNESKEHMVAFYSTFDEIRDHRFDGMIITGAPIEQIPFEEVAYWDELTRIMEWTKSNVTSTFHICWGAQAGLYYHYGIDKYALDKKMFGIFPHKIIKKQSPLLRGINDTFMVPHSRHTSIHKEPILATPELELMAESDEAGVYIVKSKDNKQIFVTGHSEYEADTLNQEYVRDVNKGLPIEMPKNYFPDDDPTREPIDVWRSHAYLLYANWLNYYVYQITPYVLEKGDKT